LELSQREVEIMRWLTAGKTNPEIGQILEISTFTVKNHVQRIFRKMNVVNRAQAVEKFKRSK
jgi:DNA-binding CsgD family transcriptional regulator